MKLLTLCVVVGLVPCGASAQVVVNPAALQQLAGIEPAAVVEVAPAVTPVKRHFIHRVVAVVKPAVVTPKVATVAPVQPVVAKPVAPAVPKPVVVAPVVVSFAAGSDGLPAGAAAALKPVCAGGAAGGLVGIDAYAPADADDPSAAMRLSLNRAFAVRDALAACGVPAAHIIPRADGAAAGADTATAKVSLGGATK